MANIISAITNNVLPGPKGFGTSKLFILKLDGDPSSSGVAADTGTLSIYNGTLYIKTGSENTDWVSIPNATGVQSDIESEILSASFGNLEGQIHVDITETVNSYISSSGLFNFSDGITVVSEVAEATGTSAAYGAPYVTISSNQFNECRLLAASNDLEIFSNACPVLSTTVQLANNRTSATVGFNVSNSQRASFTIGTPLTSSDPGLSFSYSSAGLTTEVIDTNYTDSQDIHNFQVHFETDGTLSYYVYNLGDGTGATRSTRTLVSSGNVDAGANVPAGTDVLTNIGIIGISLEGTSAFNFFNQRLILRNP